MAVAAPGGRFAHQRLTPAEPMRGWVQHLWMVQWDLRGATPSVAETLPHPNAYLVFEHDLEQGNGGALTRKNAEVSGVTRSRFTRVMEGRGRVFGLKLRPGGLRGFLAEPMASLTGRVVAAESVFGREILGLARELRAMDAAEAMAAAVALYFEAHAPRADAEALLAGELVDAVLADASILTVETLAARSGISVRGLQRLFREYVGVSPKWVIRRYRLHELLERLHAGRAFEGAQVALELGYADQAHLINDFRKLAGVAPEEYRRRAEKG
jgi:AraC-like DNA-binding protein